MNIPEETKAPKGVRNGEYFTLRKARPLAASALGRPIDAASIGTIAIRNEHCGRLECLPWAFRFIFTGRIMLAAADIADFYKITIRDCDRLSRGEWALCAVRDSSGHEEPLEFVSLSESFNVLAAHFGNASAGDPDGAGMALFDRRDAESFVKSIMHAVWPSFDWGDPGDAGTEHAPRQDAECGIDFMADPRAPERADAAETVNINAMGADFAAKPRRDPPAKVLTYTEYTAVRIIIDDLNLIKPQCTAFLSLLNALDLLGLNGWRWRDGTLVDAKWHLSRAVDLAGDLKNL